MTAFHHPYFKRWHKIILIGTWMHMHKKYFRDKFLFIKVVTCLRSLKSAPLCWLEVAIYDLIVNTLHCSDFIRWCSLSMNWGSTRISSFLEPQLWVQQTTLYLLITASKGSINTLNIERNDRVKYNKDLYCYEKVICIKCLIFLTKYWSSTETTKTFLFIIYSSTLDNVTKRGL